MRQPIKPLFSYIIYIFLILSSCLSANVYSENIERIVLKGGAFKQRIDILGGDMERSADFLFQATNPDEIIHWYFSDINMPYWRVVIDKHQELVEGKRNFAFYDKQIKVMQKIRAVDPKVKFWATLKTDYDGYGTQNNMPDWVYTGGGYNEGNYDPQAFKAKKWARFLADYLKLMHDNNVSIQILSVSKEWMQVMPALNEKNTIDQLKLMLKTPAYAGVPIPEFNGPAAWGVKQAKGFVSTVANNGYAYNYTGFSAHTYDKPSQTDWNNLLEAANKINLPVYNEESNSAGGGPFYGEEPAFSGVVHIYSGKTEAYKAGLSGELFFELWSRGYERESRSVYFTANQAGKRGRGYWLSKEFINQVYNKYYIDSVILGDSADLKIMAFADDKAVVVYIINPSKSQSYTNIPVEILDQEISSRKITKTLWSETTPIEGVISSVDLIGKNSFKINLAANSMAVYKFKINKSANIFK